MKRLLVLPFFIFHFSFDRHSFLRLPKPLVKVCLLLIIILGIGSSGGGNLSAQIISTIAGNGAGGFSGNGGPATAAEIYAVYGTKVDRLGNVYIADDYNDDNFVRKVNTLGIIIAFAGNGIGGYSGDGGPATAAEIGSLGVGVDDSGNIYIAGGTCVRKVNTSGIISTFAGIGGVGGYSGDGGPATAAELGLSRDVAADDSGNIYIVDQIDNVIRKVNTNGIISTFAGNGYMQVMTGGGGFTGDGGPATAAELNKPSSVTVDALGNVYIADYDNNRIRKVNTSGIINTIAGISYNAYSGDGGPATAAELGFPTGVATDDSGNVFISDCYNNRIRKVNTSGIISTFAGNGYINSLGNGGYSGDGGLATAAELYVPSGIATDTSGNVYISDQGNYRIRKVTVVLNVLASVTANVSCNGGNNGSVSVIASEGTNPYTYSWSPMGGSNYIATGLSAGTYTINVIDSNSLKGLAIVTITQPTTVLSASATVINNLTCFGENIGSTSSTVSGGVSPYTYLWSDANSQTTVTATGLSAGTYTLNVTDNNGCNAPAVVSITQPAAIIPVITEYSSITCNGASDATVFANATGGSGFYSYQWSDASSQNSATATGLSAGNYTVTVTDNNGCNGTASVTITQPNSLNISANTNANVSCNGGNNGTVASTVSGGTAPYTYMWSGGGGVNAIASGLSAGTYTVNVTDNNGCNTSAIVSISQPVPLMVSTSLTEAACNANNGSGIAMVSGGTSPYTYLWSSVGGTNATASGLSGGTYSVTVDDSCGGSATASVIITQAPPIGITTDSIPDNGHCSGSAWITISGGIPPYSYVWPGNQTTDTITGQCAGKYCCIVSDAQGCIDETICVTITSDAGINNLTTDNGGLAVYPNPNNGTFTLNLSNVYEKCSIDIFNILGQKIYSEILSQTQSDNTINLVSQPSGVYLYRVISESGNLIGEGKLIILKE